MEFLGNFQAVTERFDAALCETGADIEDNVQYVLAMKQKCSIIITNNFKDYRLLLNIRAVRPGLHRVSPSHLPPGKTARRAGRQDQ